MNEVTVLVIASGLNFVWGFAVFYGIYLRNTTLEPFWIIFGSVLLILGIFIPLEYLIVQTYTQLMDQHLKNLENIESFEIPNDI